MRLFCFIQWLFVTKVAVAGQVMYDVCPMDTTGIIIFSVIVLHLLAGVGYLLYKLHPGKKKEAGKEV